MKVNIKYSIIIISIVILSCGKDVKKEIVGTWEYSNTSIIFEKNGEGFMDKGTTNLFGINYDLSASFTYTISESANSSILRMNILNNYSGKIITSERKIVIDDDKLEMTYESGGIETYIRKK